MVTRDLIARLVWLRVIESDGFWKAYRRNAI